MLVKNNMPNNRSVGDIYLNPGVNQVDSKKWESLMASGYDGPVKGLIEDEVLEVMKDDKITIALVKSTYDIATLESWEDEAKGPLKGAIREQKKKLALPEKTKDGD